MIKVAILFGGISTEHDVSCKSADNVIRALAGRFELTLIGITKEGEWLHYTGDPADVTGRWHTHDVEKIALIPGMGELRAAIAELEA